MAPLLPPKVLEASRAQFRVPNGVLDVPVPEVGLQAARIMPLVGQGEPAGMPEHVRMSWEAQAGNLTSALHKLGKARCRERRATSRT